jgi:hypothetical protein
MMRMRSKVKRKEEESFRGLDAAAALELQTVAETH